MMPYRAKRAGKEAYRSRRRSSAFGFIAENAFSGVDSSSLPGLNIVGPGRRQTSESMSLPCWGIDAEP